MLKMELVFICSSILVIWLLKKYVFKEEKEEPQSFYNLIYKENVCHCKLWHKKCYGNLDDHLNPEVRAAHNIEIAEAFRSVQRSVSKFTSYSIPRSDVSAENILRHALDIITGENYLAKHVHSAIKREHTSVANCLKNAWPSLAPKVDPGPAFVQGFCQNLKEYKYFFCTATEEQHSLLEYLLWVVRKNAMVIQKVIKIISLEDTLKEAKLHRIRKILMTLVNGATQKISKASDLKSKLLRTLNQVEIKKIIAMDTEMVGAGYKGSIDMVARVSLVDKDTDCIFDKYVKPTRPVTDYRTFVSGIRDKDLIDAEDFKTVQQEIAELIKNRILVGHDLEKDLNVLDLEHPSKDIRDTAMYLPFRKMAHQKPSLKHLAKQFLGRDIQNGEHSSVEDACAAMDLYRSVAAQWEEMSILNIQHVNSANRPPQSVPQNSFTRPNAGRRPVSRSYKLQFTSGSLFLTLSVRKRLPVVNCNLWLRERAPDRLIHNLLVYCKAYTLC